MGGLDQTQTRAGNAPNWNDRRTRNGVGVRRSAWRFKEDAGNQSRTLASALRGDGSQNRSAGSSSILYLNSRKAACWRERGRWRGDRHRRRRTTRSRSSQHEVRFE